ncbi:MAG: hypothetical protein U0528_18400 [Anaerolineae bacterium]
MGCQDRSGGGWQTSVIAPVVERMLNIQAGERVLTSPAETVSSAAD